MARPKTPPEEKAINNMIKGYLRPILFHTFKAYQEMEELRQSETINEIVRHFFNTMPPERLSRVMRMKEKRRIRQMQELARKKRRRRRRRDG